MKIKGWKTLFQPHILERGEDYCCSGAVEDLSVEGDSVKATVCGSEDYRVEIELEGSKVVGMYCDCPYAEDGKNCKHMAAVLFALEDSTEENPPTDSTPVSELIGPLSEEQLRALLLELAKKNPAVESRLRVLLSGCSLDTVSTMKSEIQNILDEASNRSGFIDYDDAFGCMCDLCDYLRENVPPLLTQKAVHSAFQIVCEAFFEAASADMDDSDGGLTILMDECRNQWEQILKCADAAERDKMYRWFEAHIDGACVDFAEEVLEKVMLRCFDERPHLERSLKYAEGRLQSANSYQIPYYAQYAMELMEKLHYSEAAMEKFLRQYRYLPEIRKMEIDDAVAKKQYENALALLNESVELDRDKPGLVRGYMERIIDIFEMTAQTEKLASALMNYISSFSQYDLEYIQKYKTCLSPDKWEDELKKLLLLPTVKQIKCQLLLAEEKYRELFDEVKLHESLAVFCRYESILRDRYPAEALFCYTEQLSKSMEAASSRYHYREIIGHFKRLTYYPNGREQILLLSEQWREKYPRRRAMLEEIADGLKRCKIKRQ